MEVVKSGGEAVADEVIEGQEFFVIEGQRFLLLKGRRFCLGNRFFCAKMHEAGGVCVKNVAIVELGWERS